jgi:SAM-dependent methyltransferase
MTRPTLRHQAAIARLRELVRDAWVARGEDPDSDAAAANIDYNSTDCRSRAAALVDYLGRAYGFSMQGRTVCELGAGFGGLCMHFLLEHGAGAVLAVDQRPLHTQATETLAVEFGLNRLAAVHADLQALPGHDGTMELAVLNDVLYTANLSPDRVAAACARILRPGGLVLFRNVNRAFGPEVVSHRDGTQFLDPDSSDRAARFLGRGTGSTLAHRPLSPWALAAFLRQAGFDDFRWSGDVVDRGSEPAASRGLLPRFVLAARKTEVAPRPLHRMAPPPGGLLDVGPFRRGAERCAAAVRSAADALHDLFGRRLTREVARAELTAYLVDRLLMDGLAAFRHDPGDIPALRFADAIDRALEHALVAVLTRHGGWTSADFANAEPDRLSSVLDACVAAARHGFRQPADGQWLANVDWQERGARVMAMVCGSAGDRRGRTRTARALRRLVGDHLRLGAVGLLARTADPLTGSVAEEYAEAAIDRLEGEARDAAGQTADERHPTCREQLMRLVEEFEAEIAGVTASAGRA